PEFAEKVEDTVGLYMDPPKHTVVDSIDEKSPLHALGRTPPGLPLKPGKCGTMTHDYKRNGTTTLFAALNILDGTVIGRCMRRHRHQEFIRFLNAVERAVPAGKVVHAIVDNYAAHKQPNVLKWLADHPRWTFHFTPTSASWLNAVEGFFSAITRRQIRRGAFHSLDDLQNAITRYINAHNSDCRPFTWTTSAKAIFEKLGSVATILAHDARGAVGELSPPDRSCGAAEQVGDDDGLAPDIMTVNLSKLSLPHHRHRFETRQSSPRGMETAEAEPRPDKALDTPVVLLDDVVEVFALPQTGAVRYVTVAFHICARYGIGRILVDGEGSRIGDMRLRDGLAKQPL